VLVPPDDARAIFGELPVQADAVFAVVTAGNGFTVTVFLTKAEGPLQPIAVTWISTVPENPLAHVITPVEASILPAAALLKDQLNPVLLVAVVV
jgi:hypothetical protein